MAPGPVWQEMLPPLPSPPRAPAEWLSDEGSQPAPRRSPSELPARCRGFHSGSPGQTVALHPLDPALAIAGGQQGLPTLGQGLAAQQDGEAASPLPGLAGLLEVLGITAVSSSS